MRKRVSFSVVLASLLAFCMPAGAQFSVDERWIPGASGELHDPANWENGVVPTNGQTGEIYGGSNAIHRIDEFGDYIGTFIDDFNLLVSGGASIVTGEFHVAGGLYSVGTMTMEAGTTFSILGKTVVGYSTGSDGVLTINGGYFKTSPDGYNVIGDSGKGVVILNDGTYEVDLAGSDNTTIGYQPSGNGTFIVNGGEAKFSRNVEIGRLGTGRLEIHGGTVSVRGEIEMATNGTLCQGSLVMTGGILNVNGSFSTNTAQVSTVDISLSGDAKLNINGSFSSLSYPDRKGKFDFVITDDAELYVAGNFWSGSNNDGSDPLDGETWAATYTFSGNSVVSVEELWFAMSAKSYVVVEENTSITSRGGYMGLGLNARSGGSKLVMTGGELHAEHFLAGAGVGIEAVFSGGVANFVGGNGKAGMSFHGDSVLTLEGEAIMNVGEAFINDGTFNMAGGTLNITTMNKNGGGEFNFTDGLLIVETVNFDQFHQQGGIISPGGDGQRADMTINGNFLSSGGEIAFDLLEGETPDFITVTGNWSIHNDILFRITSNYAVETGAVFDLAHILGDFAASDIAFISTYDQYWVVRYNNETGILSIQRVPEPATWLLLGLGVLAMGMFRKRKTRRA